MTFTHSTRQTPLRSTGDGIAGIVGGDYDERYGTQDIARTSRSKPSGQ